MSGDGDIREDGDSREDGHAVRPGATAGRHPTTAGDDAPADRWYCGPPGQRRAYAVDDLGGVEGGQGLVVRAERRTFAGDAIGYTGAASLKLTTERRPQRVALLRDRWAQLARIEHPNVVRALEVFEGPGLFRTECPPDTADDVLYVAAGWVEGRCLRGVAPLDPPAAFGLARDVAAGLDALHAHGLLHRDVHPGNVVVDDVDRAVIIDLGSARPDDGGTTTTVAGALGFIPPETLHATGGAAADRWGLGMVTVFALLGHPQGTMSRAGLEAELGSALAGIDNPRGAVDLLCALTDPDPARRPLDTARWAADLTACLDSSRRRRRVPVPLAVAAGAIGLVAAGAVLASLLDDDATTAEDVGSASAQPASTTPTCTPVTAGAGGTSAALAGAVARLAPGGCAGGPAERFVDAEVQPLTDATGQPDGVVVLPPSGKGVRLNDTMWASYREIAGKTSPQNAAIFGGYPVAVEQPTDPDAVVIRLDAGGLVIGRRADTQMFWLPTHVLDLWEAHGGLTGELGFPTTNPYFVGGQLHLDFEHGYMQAEMRDFASLLLGAEVDTAVVLDGTEAAAPLRDTEIGEHIVRQTSGSAWWVDADGARHWIPDGGTWQCLGGEDAVALDHLPGWAVATLPLADPATCP
jgi:hypothetical protein